MKTLLALIITLAVIGTWITLSVTLPVIKYPRLVGELGSSFEDGSVEINRIWEESPGVFATEYYLEER